VPDDPTVDLDEHNARVVQRLQEDGRVWIASAVVDGRTAIRPCFVNFRTTDDDVRAIVDEVCRVGE
jgi:aromatic-L-amino-acid decarboxylase